MATVIISIGAYTAPSPNTLINLAFFPDNAVCDKVKTSYRISTSTFVSTSLVYNTNDTVAAAGWYSDGTNKAYWNGTILSSYSACVVIAITFNSFTGTQANFTITGGSVSALNLQKSTNAGVTWTSSLISSTSPVTGLTAPTVETLVRLQSVDNLSLFSNALLYNVNFQSQISPGCVTITNAKEAYIDAQSGASGTFVSAGFISSSGSVGQENDSIAFYIRRFYLNFSPGLVGTPTAVNLKIHTTGNPQMLKALKSTPFGLDVESFDNRDIYTNYSLVEVASVNVGWINFPLNSNGLSDLIANGYLDIAIVSKDDFDALAPAENTFSLTDISLDGFKPYLEIIY
jgi:hypothetical protein